MSELIDAHLHEWAWMRDRDLLFEPWDTPEHVVQPALNTGGHEAPDYSENLRRNVAGLAFHCDLSLTDGRAHDLNNAVRFFHDLNVERENHHVLWLKYSYPLRRLAVEVERRLVCAGSLEPGDIFFMQMPELIGAVRRLPSPLPDEVVALVRNRRVGFLKEARMDTEGDPEPVDEDDYY